MVRIIARIIARFVIEILIAILRGDDWPTLGDWFSL